MTRTESPSCHQRCVELAICTLREDKKEETVLKVKNYWWTFTPVRGPLEIEVSSQGSYIPAYKVRTSSRYTQVSY